MVINQILCYLANFFFIYLATHLSAPLKPKLAFQQQISSYLKPLPRPTPSQRPILPQSEDLQPHQAHTTDQDQGHLYHLLAIPKVHLK